MAPKSVTAGYISALSGTVLAMTVDQLRDYKADLESQSEEITNTLRGVRARLNELETTERQATAKAKAKAKATAKSLALQEANDRILSITCVLDGTETVIRVRAKRGVGFLKSEFRKEANIPESQKHLYRFTFGTVNIGALEPRTSCRVVGLTDGSTVNVVRLNEDDTENISEANHEETSRIATIMDETGIMTVYGEVSGAESD